MGGVADILGQIKQRTAIHTKGFFRLNKMFYPVGHIKLAVGAELGKKKSNVGFKLTRTLTLNIVRPAIVHVDSSSSDLLEWARISPPTHCCSSSDLILICQHSQNE